jgi:Tol biopolymer transport system component
MTSFGPWTTSISPGPVLKLSAFWKRRMTLLHPSSLSNPKLTWPALLVLLAVGVVAGLLPAMCDAPVLAEPKGEAAAKKKGRIYLTANLEVKRAGQDEAERLQGVLIAVDPESGKWQKITDQGYNPRISPDGETVVFVKHSDRSEIWNCDTGGSNNPGKISDWGSLPIWSPDGKSLVTTQGRFIEKKGWDDQTWQFDADGGNARKLPIPATDEVDDWSRDGKWFVTVSDRHPPHGHGYQLYVMHPDGTDQRRITKDGLNCYPRFSPDSKWIVYLHQTRKEGNSIWVVDVDGKNAHCILKEDGGITPDYACWSPDGKHLAVLRFTTGVDLKHADYHLQIMDADGGNPRTLKLAGATVTWLGHGDWR